MYSIIGDFNARTEEERDCGFRRNSEKGSGGEREGSQIARRIREAECWWSSWRKEDGGSLTEV